jgi:hypothetical protein
MFPLHLARPLLALALAALITLPATIEAQGPAPASNADAPAAITLTFPPHTHLTVNQGHAMVVQYRGGTTCPLEIRHDPGVAMFAIGAKDDPRGLTGFTWQ